VSSDGPLQAGSGIETLAPDDHSDMLPNVPSDWHKTGRTPPTNGIVQVWFRVLRCYFHHVSLRIERMRTLPDLRQLHAE
jgi:hypothetical protein